MENSLNLKIEFLGHSTLLIETQRGKRLLVDPWLNDNPACSKNVDDLQRVDLMLITHGHFDHCGDALGICKRYRPMVFAIHEVCRWLERQGVAKTSGMNVGGTQAFEGIRVTMVPAVHSSSMETDSGIEYMGEATGFVVRFESGGAMYIAGDTSVFGDMAIIRQLYSPDVAVLPIGGHYVMDPRQAALAVDLLGVKKVLPVHYGTFPVLTGTPGQLKSLLDGKGVQVMEMEPGESRAI